MDEGGRLDGQGHIAIVMNTETVGKCVHSLVHCKLLCRQSRLWTVTKSIRPYVVCHARHTIINLMLGHTCAP